MMLLTLVTSYEVQICENMKNAQHHVSNKGGTVLQR